MQAFLDATPMTKEKMMQPNDVAQQKPDRSTRHHQAEFRLIHLTRGLAD